MILAFATKKRLNKLYISNINKKFMQMMITKLFLVLFV